MIELHVHLDGSLRPSTIWELAKEMDGKAPAESLAELKSLMEAPVSCKSLSQYLSCFGLPIKYLQTQAALERVAMELIEDLAYEGITYAELRFAPQLSTALGLTQMDVTNAVVAGVKKGMERYPSIKAGILLCSLRGVAQDVWDKNLETMHIAASLKDQGIVCGVDLVGAEEVFDTGLFRDLFREADKYNLKKTIHAGEASGPDSMWKALEMGAMRIGHGIAAIKDEELIKELVKRKTVLEVCVTSNVQTKGVQSLEEHPLRKLYDAGVRVTLNTDNRTVSGTTLLKEIELVKGQFGFSKDELKQMDEYAAQGAFLTTTEL